MKIKKVILRCLLFCIKQLWRVRYQVSYRGLDEVLSVIKNTDKGTLFLPNHPAIFIDPLIIAVPLIDSCAVRPLVVEYMFYNPLFHWAVRLVNALPMPNFATGFNPIKLKRSERMLQKMSDGLKNGENFLIYPSGTTKFGPKEVLGGAFGAHKLLTENPDANVVLVRLTGLWGSVFSRALLAGELADTAECLKKALWDLCKNFIFFMPKREVTCEFVLAPKDFPKKGSLIEVNRYLEEWYNKPFSTPQGNPGEPLTLVSYSRWKNELPHVVKREEESLDLSQVSHEIKKKVIAKIAELARISEDQVMPAQDLFHDLGLDSLDVADLVTFLTDECNVSGIIPGELTTVHRTLLIAAHLYKKKEVKEPEHDLRQWLRPASNKRLQIPEARSIPEAFLKQADKNPNAIACADPQSGAITYFEMKKKIFLLAEKIRVLPGERIGVLLPASIGVNVVILACQCAGKVPVMINWTVGGKHLDTVVEVSGIQAVLTSWSFLDNLDNVDISRIEEMLVVLEEIRAEISLFDIFKALKCAYSSSDRLLGKKKYAHLRSSFYKEAVVLFTSGTEAHPKGVPLTHGNLLDNQRAILDVVALTRNDKMLAMLPSFHSFGLAITGIMPLIAGMKVVFYPNPTDSKRLARACKIWQTTLICTAPTFLKNIMLLADESSLQSLRLIVSGAEKAPDELFRLMERQCPQAQFYEGYGITECSPVLTVNAAQGREKGVGKPLPRVEVCIVDPDTYAPIQGDAVGLICVRGPNVFSGYLNKDTKDPFVDIAGHKWYNTGDLGKLLSEGSLVLAGRMKRFVKIGGEMLSLAAIEEIFLPLTVAKQEREGLPQLAVMTGPEEGGRPKLVLFINAELELMQANQMLRQHGFSNLVKIDKVCTIDAIPITGTGKIAYRQLETKVKSLLA